MTLFSSQFHYNPRTKTLSAFASDLPSPFMGPLYPDAADIGFELVSVKTHRHARFYLVREESDRDLGVFCWVFAPDAKSVADTPSLEGVSAVIHND